VFMNGATIPTTDAYGERIVDDSFLVIFNASDDPIEWCIPGPEWSRRWTIDLDTSDPKRGVSRTVNKRPGDLLEVPDRSMVVLRSVTPASLTPATLHAVHRRTTPSATGPITDHPTSEVTT